MTVDFAEPRNDWTLEEVLALFELPFSELVFQAAAVHRRWFDASQVQLSQLLSIKTGGCPEDCPAPNLSTSKPVSRRRS
jgi:biotin synthase